MSLNEKDITIDAYNKSTGNVLKLNPTQLAYLKARLSEKAFKAYYLYYHGEKVSKISETLGVSRTMTLDYIKRAGYYLSKAYLLMGPITATSPIEFLALTTRAENALKRGGIETVGQLIELKAKHRKVRGFDPRKCGLAALQSK